MIPTKVPLLLYTLSDRPLIEKHSEGLYFVRFYPCNRFYFVIYAFSTLQSYLIYTYG